MRKSNIQNDAAFREIWASKAITREIAAKYQCSIAAVSNAVRQFGLPRRSRSAKSSFYAPPAAFAVAIVPATDGVVAKVEEFGNYLAGFSVIQQQERIRPLRNVMILALTANAGLKFKALCRGKKTGTCHRHI